jgi:hypothetical protein
MEVNRLQREIRFVVDNDVLDALYLHVYFPIEVDLEG